MSGSNSSHPVAAPATEQPLELTVHSLPSPRAAGEDDERRTATGRWKMLLVLAVCAAPVIASYLTYYVIRPEGRRNFGELVEPQRAMPSATALTPDGKAVALDSLKGQWLIVSVAGGACAQRCQEHLYLQRQLRQTLGREKDRVDWVWLIDDQAPVPAALQSAVAQATVLRLPREQLSAWLAPAPGQALADHLYLVDPMGNFMLRFPAGLDRAVAGRAKRDLDRVLRASASWDQAGRQAR